MSAYVTTVGLETVQPSSVASWVVEDTRLNSTSQLDPLVPDILVKQSTSEHHLLDLLVVVLNFVQNSFRSWMIVFTYLE